MTEDEQRRIAWETVCARIDDLAACLHAVGGSVPLSVGRLLELNHAFGHLDAARRHFYGNDVPRLMELGQQARHG